jgi:hypothetical protein
MVLPASERTSFFGACLRIREPRVRGMVADRSPGDERDKSTVHATWLCVRKKIHSSIKTWNKGSRSCASHAAEGRKSSWCMRCKFRCL